MQEAMWTLSEAVALCRKVEAVCPAYGCHVALTGGTLYKDGARKDTDLLFYNIRQVDALGRESLLLALQGIGFEMGAQHGWVQKATVAGKPVDLLFPEAYPSSARPSRSGTY